eukprot:TRINITY_DN3365_c0_g1_i1.p1 TRINITY_DN3365_c0_g1~~TRINITY_DN3365_c0_g1_i1.p1  ORF type:complete len:170 (+),score=41.95 TRINITY_DN3365_c0_g1_i1:98-607(+)
MIRRPPRSTQSRSSAASDVYKRQVYGEGFTEDHGDEILRLDPGHLDSSPHERASCKKDAPGSPQHGDTKSEGDSEKTKEHRGDRAEGVTPGHTICSGGRNGRSEVAAPLGERLPLRGEVVPGSGEVCGLLVLEHLAVWAPVHEGGVVGGGARHKKQETKLRHSSPRTLR